LNSGIILDNQDAPGRLGCRDRGNSSTDTEWRCEIPHRKTFQSVCGKTSGPRRVIRKHHLTFEAYNRLTTVLVKGFSI
jgi:hypothetical protein